MKRSAAFGTAAGKAYAVQIDALSANDFFKLPLGRQLDDRNKVAAFKDQAQTTWIGCKGKPTLSAVRRWVRHHKPQQFFASWGADSPCWKDDVVEIHYIQPTAVPATVPQAISSK